MNRLAWLLCIFALVACEGSETPVVSDASTDRGSDVSGPTDASLPTDAAPASCVSDRECSAAGLVCNPSTSRCVECNAAADCGVGRACVASRCVATTPCTTARMCPGQVCNTTLGFCVDCNTDVDCTGGQLCRGNVCVAPPRACTSSRECSAMAQVCDTARSQCVDCVADTDCPMDRYCGAERTCLMRVCAPNATSCASLTRQRTCNAQGSMQAEADCAAGQTCRGTTCQATVCTPAQTTCDPATSMRRRCNDDGGGFTVMPCADGESCRDGACVMRACTPGAAACASSSERRICSADGLSTMVAACAAGEGCRDGVCVTRTCAPGAATCMSTTVRSVCNADGLGVTTTPCGATQRCASGACVDLACTPGSSTCVDPLTVRVCNADGSAAMNVTCPASSTCTGTMCSGWVCTPGSATCPAGATARSICNADGLTRRSEACVAPANAAMARCGVGDTCAYTCNAGFGDCNGLAADGCEVTLATTVAHCGRCGMACPTGVSCVGGTCSSEPTLRVDALASTGCVAFDTESAVRHTGIASGGIALSSTQVFATLDREFTTQNDTVRASLADLSGLARTTEGHDTMLHDLSTGQVYVMLTAADTEVLFSTSAATGGASTFTATQLGVLDGATGLLTSSRVPLSTPLTVRYNYQVGRSTLAGFFSGRGRAYLFVPTSTAESSPGTWFEVRLPSGVVSTLRTDAPQPERVPCINALGWWGTAEYFGGERYAVFVESQTRLVRYRLRDGVTTTLGTLPASSFAMCSIAVSPSNNRWYFQYLGRGFVGGTSSFSSLFGYCDATISTP